MKEPSERALAAASQVWARATEQLAVLQMIAGAGCVFEVKVDGEHARGRFTVVLTGGVLRDAPFRGDGDNLGALLEAAIAHFSTHAWKVDASP